MRRLNILLKFARLYGLEHSRSATQFSSTWEELKENVSIAGEAGLLLGASGSQLLLDGVPLESTHAERSFAELLNSSGVASICFSPSVEREEFSNLVRDFVATGPRTGNSERAPRAAFRHRRKSGIRVNEIRFVAEDAAFADARVAAQLTAKTLGADADHIRGLVPEPGEDDSARSPRRKARTAERAPARPGSANQPRACGAGSVTPALRSSSRNLSLNGRGVGPGRSSLDGVRRQPSAPPITAARRGRPPRLAASARATRRSHASKKPPGSSIPDHGSRSSARFPRTRS